MAEKIHLFQCSCESSDEGKSFDEFKKHLADVHGLTKKEDLTGKKEKVMHLDGAKFFSSTYKWILNNGLTFTEYYESSRSKKDPMYYKK